MKRKRMAIAAAVAMAGLVLLVTLLAGPDAPAVRDDGAPHAADLDFDTRFNAGNTGRGDGLGLSMPHETEHGELLFTDPQTGRLTRLYWAHMTPQSRFVYDMTEPMVRIIFNPSRILEVTGDRGHFEINDQENQIQRGTLSGNVTVRLLETQDGSDVDLYSGRDEQLRMTLGDEAEFDMELGELTSESAIRVTGPRVEFSGYGLLLSYNRLRDRIDRLIIDRDVSLRLRPQPQLAASRSAATAEDAAKPQRPVKTDGSAKPPLGRELGAERQAAERAEATGTESEEAPKPVQFYVAHFEKNVVVTADQRDTRMTGDRLDATFTFAGGDLTPRNDAPPARRASARRAQHAHDPTPVDTPPSGAPSHESSTETPADNDPGEVLITCDGRLFMEPLLDPDADLRDDPKAMLLALVGDTSPAVITTGAGETVTGRRVDYLTTTGRMRAEAGEGDVMPMRIRSAALGDLTGRSLHLDPNAAAGVIVGPGSFVTVPRESDADANDPADAPLRLTWEDRLDLAFFTRPRDSGPDELLAIRTATFRGHARVEHPDFQMTSDELVAHAERADGTGAQRLAAIDAAGRARMTAQRTPDGEPMSIAGDTMHIDVTTDTEGRQQPSRLLAEGDVTAEQPGTTLRTARLDAHLGMVVETEGEPAQLGVTEMTATGGVMIDSDDPAGTLTGDRMVVNGNTRQMELFAAPAPGSGPGSGPGNVARVENETSSLSGAHLVMNEGSQTVHVVGAGVFTFLNQPTSDAGDGEATLVTVTWAESMHFDQANGYAQFVGEVVTTAESATDQTTLTCDDLRLDFESSDDDEAGTSDTFRGRRIRTATARGGPVFRSRSFDALAPDVDLTRFRLEGPLMTFENTPSHEWVQVIGEGRMLVEDYRATETRSSKPETRNTAVKVSGKGQTLFTWQRQLTLDAARNDMLMEQNVQMVHRPLGEKPGAFGEVATLSCNKLFADLSASQGMDGWLSDASPKPNVHMIVADRDVKIAQGRKRAFCDRLAYLGERNAIELAAARGKQVRIEDQDRPVPLTGTGFEWDLDTDAFNLKRPGAMTVPLPQ